MYVDISPDSSPNCCLAVLCHRLLTYCVTEWEMTSIYKLAFWLPARLQVVAAIYHSATVQDPFLLLQSFTPNKRICKWAGVRREFLTTFWTRFCVFSQFPWFLPRCIHTSPAALRSETQGPGAVPTVRAPQQLESN